MQSTLLGMRLAGSPLLDLKAKNQIQAETKAGTDLAAQKVKKTISSVKEAKPWFPPPSDSSQTEEKKPTLLPGSPGKAAVLSRSPFELAKQGTMATESSPSVTVKAWVHEHKCVFTFSLTEIGIQSKHGFIRDEEESNFKMHLPDKASPRITC
ncbi:hypothetical protein SAY87_024365 [Trapa incisa]|uniref:Uncharacterized protein n=1 Tax=Trapa incisa TaxID=236973 RepID=A0AAN7GKQ8_9MYRT|nr:hypothetical protein SAY87_024365 [Trapa incisa]